MIFDFLAFVESWAEIYKPMQHRPKKNERVFVTQSFFQLTSGVQGVDVRTGNPIAVVENDCSGVLGDKFDEPSCTVYFLCRSKEVGDARYGDAAKKEAKEAMKAFVNALRAFVNADRKEVEKMHLPDEGYLHDLYVQDFELGRQICRGINVARIAYQNINELWDGWQGVGITIDTQERCSRCVIETDYD